MGRLASCNFTGGIVCFGMCIEVEPTFYQNSETQASILARLFSRREMSHKLLRGLSSAIQLCQDWEDTRQKLLLWNTLLSLVSLPNYRFESHAVDFLTHEVIIASLSSGLLVYTIREMQVNINMAIPKDDTLMETVLEEMTSFIGSMHADCAINMSPIRIYYTNPEYIPLCPRRFIPGPHYANRMELTKEGVISCLGRTIEVQYLVVHIGEIATVKPITRMARTDPDNTLYWYRFPCLTIATFLNPIMEQVEAIEFPPPIEDMLVVRGNTNSNLWNYVQALMPFQEDQTLAVLNNNIIPAFLRELCFLSSVHTFGIGDNLLHTAHKYFKWRKELAPLLRDMLSIGGLMQKEGKYQNIPDLLVSALEGTSNAQLWNAWILRSLFVRRTIDTSPPKAVNNMCAKIDSFCAVLLSILHDSIGNWSDFEVQKAASLTEFGSFLELDRLADILQEQQRVTTKTVSKQPLCASKSHTRKKPTRKEGRNTFVKKEPPLQEVVVYTNSGCKTEATATHKPLVARMAKTFCLDIFLIGSGVFSDQGDVDIAITVGAHHSLTSAYAAVILATGWVPQYSNVTGSRVAVLAGQYEGFAVDAQVWRGGQKVECTAERLTSNAILLANTLDTHANTATKRCVRLLHQWVEASSSKGHKLCRMPGVAVTCICILLGCRMGDHSDLGRILHLFRDCLSLVMPVIKFDDDMQLPEREVSSLGRCAVSLSVCLYGENCSTRMTVGTTRHLLDTVAYTLSNPLDIVYDKGHYTAWRDNTMVMCVKMRPLATNSVSFSLKTTVAALDGHPMIDTVHVEECDNGCLAVRCSLKPECDVSRYGLHASDTIFIPLNKIHVCIDRKGRRLRIMQSRRPATVRSLDHCSRVTDMIWMDGMEKGMSFPNAPYLTVDVASHFDARFWECVYE